MLRTVARVGGPGRAAHATIPEPVAQDVPQRLAPSSGRRTVRGGTGRAWRVIEVGLGT